MAEVLDQDEELMQQQEQDRLLEEERQRLLEEALAQQQDFVEPPPIPLGGNYVNQPQREIDALQAQFNQQAQPTAFVPAVRESYTPDSAQYQAEVARAQRGSGFVNADVGASGNVITPGYDPERDPMAIKARQEATNLQRNNYINSLVQGGATPAEAMRAAWGRFPLSGGTTSEQVKLAALMERNQPRPLRTEVRDGVTYVEGPQGWRAVSTPKPVQPKLQGGAPTPIAIAESRDIANEISTLREELKTGTKPGLDLAKKPTRVPFTETERREKEARIKALQDQRKALLDRPEFNPKVDQPSWWNMRDRFNAAGKVEGIYENHETKGAEPISTDFGLPQKRTQQSPATAAPTTAPQKKVNEVVRIVKGRRAVYNADTKEFIRFE